MNFIKTEISYLLSNIPTLTTKKKISHGCDISLKLRNKTFYFVLEVNLISLQKKFKTSYFIDINRS